MIKYESENIHLRVDGEAYFAGDDKCAQEYAFIGPLFEGNVEMGFCPVQVDKGGQDHGNFYFCPCEDIVDHGGEG